MAAYTSPKRLTRAWAAIAAALVLAGLALVAARASFALSQPPGGVPALVLAAGCVIAGATGLLLLPLCRRTASLAASVQGRLLVIIVTVGLALRLMMLWSEPAFEVDYQRYLWDGALTAHGYNPYALSPSQIGDLLVSDPRARLWEQSDGALDHLSYPELRTVYPPVAQAAFAVAHVLAPFSLTAWRWVCIGGEVATLLLLLRLLAATGRPLPWVSLYWWNPLPIKELVNSAHMEAILIPLVLGALLLLVQRREIAASFVLALAAGAKLWPLLLLPLVLRPLWQAPGRLALAVGLVAAVLAACALPILLAGIDPSSGYVAYATQWKTSSALFPAWERTIGLAVPSPPFAAALAGQIARGMLAVAVLALALWSARPVLRNAADTVGRALVVVSGLVLLSPSEFPWYVLWVLPLVVLRPVTGWLAAAMLAPLYYTAFHFIAVGSYEVYRDVIVWAIWLPVWALLARDVDVGSWRAAHRS